MHLMKYGVGAENSLRSDATKCAKRRGACSVVFREGDEKIPILYCHTLGSRYGEFSASGRHKMWKKDAVRVRAVDRRGFDFRRILWSFLFF